MTNIFRKRNYEESIKECYNNIFLFTQVISMLMTAVYLVVELMYVGHEVFTKLVTEEDEEGEKISYYQFNSIQFSFFFFTNLKTYRASHKSTDFIKSEVILRE